MNYKLYLAAGLPIATGVVEGACGRLAKDRMEIAGARWRLESAEAVLRLHAWNASGDLDAYWTFPEAQDYEHPHAARYAARKRPAVKSELDPDPRPRLRVLK